MLSPRVLSYVEERYVHDLHRENTNTEWCTWLRTALSRTMKLFPVPTLTGTLMTLNNRLSAGKEECFHPLRTLPCLKLLSFQAKKCVSPWCSMTSFSPGANFWTLTSVYFSGDIKGFFLKKRMFCSFTGRGYPIKFKTKIIPYIPYIRIVGHIKGPNLHHFLSRIYTIVYMLTYMIDMFGSLSPLIIFI